MHNEIYANRDHDSGYVGTFRILLERESNHGWP